MNEALVEVNGQNRLCLVDTGAQVSCLTTSLALELKTPIYHLDEIIKIEGSGGNLVPYYGYVEVRLKIPEVKAFDEDILMLVVDDSEYGERVPLQLGTLQIDRAMELMTPEELAKLTKTWRATQISTALALKSGQVVAQGEDGFSLADVQGNVKLSKSITLLPFQMVRCQGLSKVKTHRK